MTALVSNLRKLTENFKLAACLFILLLASEYIMHAMGTSYPMPLQYKNIYGTVAVFALFLGVTFLPLALSSAAVVVVSLCVLLQWMNQAYFGVPIQPIAIWQAFAETNEIGGFVGANLGMFVFPVVVAFLTCAAALILNLQLAKSRVRSAFPLILLLLLVTNDFWNVYKKTHAEKKLEFKSAMKIFPNPQYSALPNFYRSFRYFCVYLGPHLIWGTKGIVEELPEPKLASEKQVNVILVIGESLRAQQLGILGYNLDTTPELSRIEGMYKQTIYADGLMTTTSVSALMNRLENPMAVSQLRSQKNNLLRLAEIADYTTHFISAQFNREISTTEFALGRKFADEFLTRSDMPRNTSRFDDALLDYLGKIDLRKRNFIVLHMRGSHAPYSSVADPARRKFDSDYDNSILTTDHVLAQVVSEVAKPGNLPSYVLFTSDHGELLGERGIQGHGFFEPEVERVPFLFKSVGTNCDDCRVEKVLSHYDVATLVEHLLGYDVDVSDANDRTIYINGSGLDGVAGYKKIEIKNGQVVSENVFW